LQLVRDLMPNSALFGVLVDPANPGVQSTLADLQAAAPLLGLQLQRIPVIWQHSLHVCNNGRIPVA